MTVSSKIYTESLIIFQSTPFTEHTLNAKHWNTLQEIKIKRHILTTGKINYRKEMWNTLEGKYVFVFVRASITKSLQRNVICRISVDPWAVYSTTKTLTIAVPRNMIPICETVVLRMVYLHKCWISSCDADEENTSHRDIPFAKRHWTLSSLRKRRIPTNVSFFLFSFR